MHVGRKERRFTLQSEFPWVLSVVRISEGGRISGVMAYLAEDAHYAVAQLFRMVSLYP